MKDILIGNGDLGENVVLRLDQSNRHGLIAGATGTGKTITLQILAEQFSRAGTAVFMADVKGDLSGLAAAGKDHPEVQKRLKAAGVTDFPFAKNPCFFWDMFGKTGLPIRCRLDRFGPLLLSRLFDLNDVQSDIVHIAFRIAKDKKWPLIKLEDLRALLGWISDNSADLRSDYGNIAKNSIGAIQRDLVAYADIVGDNLFGEPTLDVNELVATDKLSPIHILDATKLMQNKSLYSSVLLWILDELYNSLPETGDPDKPKLVFFFDEAHILFRDAPKALMEKIELVVRLIRSKGVGIFFVTQNPADIPQVIQSQLGNRIIHGLRGFTQKDQKMLKNISQSLPVDGKFDVAQSLGELSVGESIVSVLNEKGSPSNARKVLNMAPSSKIGPIDTTEIRKENAAHETFNKYTKTSDAEGAKALIAKAAKKQAEAAEEEEAEEEVTSKSSKPKKRASTRQSASEAMWKSFLRRFGSAIATLCISFIRSFLKRR